MNRQPTAKSALKPLLTHIRLIREFDYVVLSAIRLVKAEPYQITVRWNRSIRKFLGGVGDNSLTTQFSCIPAAFGNQGALGSAASMATLGGSKAKPSSFPVILLGSLC